MLRVSLLSGSVTEWVSDGAGVDVSSGEVDTEVVGEKEEVG